MTRSYFIGILLLLSHLAQAQIDSLQYSLDSLSNLSSLQWVRDSITINAWADSLKISVQNKFNPDSIHLKDKIDSLSSLQLSTEPYSRQMDSLINSKQSKLAEIREKQNELTSKTKTRIDQWQRTVRSRLDSLGFKGNIPGVDIPGLKQLDMPSFNLPEIPTLSADDFTSIDFSPDLSKLNQNLPFVSIDGLKGVQENIAVVTEKLSLASDLKNNAGQNIESAIGEIDAVGEIKKQTEALDDIKPPDQDEIKEQAIETTVDHFAGNNEQLNQAMQEVSKYKQKYSDVKSLKDLPKKVPNPMKEKTFVERLVPGMTFQILKKDNFLLDVAPYLGYRFTGRLTIGAGWNQRISFNSEKTSTQTNVYGPRVYGDYNVFKGFSGRLELETMNAFVPQDLKITDNGQREWVPAILLGIKQQYTIYKTLKGTALVLYNFYNPDYKSPYGDRLNVRFGLEYAFKKKKKDKENK